MNYKLFLLVGVLSALIVVASCNVKPGTKAFAGQAIGVPCDSEYDCDRGETCSRGVCTDTAPEEAPESAAEESSSDLSDESGYGASECTDSDKGKDYLTAGTVNVNGETHKDPCHTFSDGSMYLFEAVCANPQYGTDPWYYVQKKCEESSGVQGMEQGAYQCGEGKCVKKDIDSKKVIYDSFEYALQKDGNLYKGTAKINGNSYPFVFNLAEQTLTFTFWETDETIELAMIKEGNTYNALFKYGGIAYPSL